jgi:biotin carboxyl carrier protein
MQGGHRPHARRDADVILALQINDRRLQARTFGHDGTLHVRAGDRVNRDAPFLALEAIKMEHVITAPTNDVLEVAHVTTSARAAAAVTPVDFRAE